jgi:quinol monooxygenase YgiN
LIYAVSYVEVMPASRADGLMLLKRYREATVTANGNVRCEVVSRIGQPHHFVVLEAWKDQQVFEANGKAQGTMQTRASLAAIRNAPLDERVHVGVSVGPLPAASGRDAVFVVTHVDVIPPRKDDGLAALKELGDAGRGVGGDPPIPRQARTHVGLALRRAHVRGRGVT